MAPITPSNGIYGPHSGDTRYQNAEMVLNTGYSQVRLQLRYKPARNLTGTHFQSVDVILISDPCTFPNGACIPSQNQDAYVCEQIPYRETMQYVKIGTSEPAIALIRMAAAAGAAKRTETGLKLILPAYEGYMYRLDIIEERMRGCDLVESAAGFAASTEQRLVPCNDSGSLASILTSACGGLIVKTQSDSQVQSLLNRLENELEARLSFRWLSTSPVQRKRLAVVQARRKFSTIERFYMAAKALNVSLIAVDSPGHWLQADDSPNASLREAFIPLDMVVNDSFPQRLYDALKDFKLDGIITSNDEHLVGVAQAAEMLGLPTMPSESLKVATDKYATRMAEEHDGACFSVDSLAELDQLLADPAKGAIEFPVIVKPCLGWSSDCVARVTNNDELRQAVHRASTRHVGYTKVVIEPYIDGPEVDTSMILLDGECLFFEISDDFPSTGDITGTSAEAGNFQETQIMYPTALPEHEQIILRNSIRKSLLRLGLHTGVYHVEARVRNSTTCFQPDENGLIDLRVRKGTASTHASCWLIEINARPPGGFSDWATAYANGVCYHAQSILAAINDKERFRALATSFKQSSQGCCPEPQFHCMLTYISPERSGVLANSPCDELQLHSPGLMENVLRCRCWYKQGDKLSGPQDSSLRWLATYLVFARSKTNGREDTLRVGDKVRKGIRVEIV